MKRRPFNVLLVFVLQVLTATHVHGLDITFEDGGLAFMSNCDASKDGWRVVSKEDLAAEVPVSEGEKFLSPRGNGTACLEATLYRKSDLPSMVAKFWSDSPNAIVQPKFDIYVLFDGVSILAKNFSSFLGSRKWVANRIFLPVPEDTEFKVQIQAEVGISNGLLLDKIAFDGVHLNVSDAYAYSTSPYYTRTTDDWPFTTYPWWTTNGYSDTTRVPWRTTPDDGTRPTNTWGPYSTTPPYPWWTTSGYPDTTRDPWRTTPDGTRPTTTWGPYSTTTPYPRWTTSGYPDTTRDPWRTTPDGTRPTSTWRPYSTTTPYPWWTTPGYTDTTRDPWRTTPDGTRPTTTWRPYSTTTPYQWWTTTGYPDTTRDPWYTTPDDGTRPTTTWRPYSTTTPYPWWTTTGYPDTTRDPWYTTPDGTHSTTTWRPYSTTTPYPRWTTSGYPDTTRDPWRTTPDGTRPTTTWGPYSTTTPYPWWTTPGYTDTTRDPWRTTPDGTRPTTTWRPYSTTTPYPWWTSTAYPDTTRDPWYTTPDDGTHPTTTWGPYSTTTPYPWWTSPGYTDTTPDSWWTPTYPETPDPGFNETVVFDFRDGSLSRWSPSCLHGNANWNVVSDEEVPWIFSAQENHLLTIDAGNIGILESKRLIVGPYSTISVTFWLQTYHRIGSSVLQIYSYSEFQEKSELVADFRDFENIDSWRVVEFPLNSNYSVRKLQLVGFTDMQYGLLIDKIVVKDAMEYF